MIAYWYILYILFIYVVDQEWVDGFLENTNTFDIVNILYHIDVYYHEVRL